MTAEHLWLSTGLKYCQCISNEDTTKLQLATKTSYHSIIQNDNNPYPPGQKATISQMTLSNAFFLNETLRFFINILLKLVPKGPIDNNPALV